MTSTLNSVNLSADANSSAQKDQQNPQPTNAKLNWVNVIFFAVFHLIAIGAAPFYFSWEGVVAMVVLHWLTGSIGICLGYHRLLSHRSFQAPAWVEAVVAVIGSLAMQGGPIFWVGGHRQHHGFTEHMDKDPYSSTRGFWWSHVLWILYAKPEHFKVDNYKKFAPDLAARPFFVLLDKYFLLLQIPSALILFALGEYAFHGLGMSFVVYGLFLRAVLLWHSTWFINSACHMWGYRNFPDAKDHATNLWWSAILAYGEGWHNNHHTYPQSAKAGLKWWEFDPTWGAIRVLEAFGLATKINLPAPWQKEGQNI